MLKEYVKYYYKALSPDEKRVYGELYDGIKRRDRQIIIRTNRQTISMERLGDIAVAVYNDAPSFYYLNIKRYTCGYNQYGYVYEFDYLYPEHKILEYDRKLEAGLSRFAAKYMRKGMSEYEREKIIHDFLVKTVVYDEGELTVSAPQNDEAYNVLGPLLKKCAVCWGIACAFKLMCDYFHVKSIVVTGNVVPQPSTAGHAWNIVMLDGETYHVDVTWDIKKKGDISCCYDYFNSDDRLMRLDHSWDRAVFPECQAVKYNYYYMNRLFVKNTDELTSFIAAKLRAGLTYISVKFVNRMPANDLLLNAIQAGFAKANVYTSFGYIISEQTHNIYLEIGD